MLVISFCWYRARLNAKKNKTNNRQPCLCFMYFLNYVDRNTIAQARLNGLEADLGMSGEQFNTTVSMYGLAEKNGGEMRGEATLT